MAIDIDVRGEDKVLRAAVKLPSDAAKANIKEQKRLAKNLAAKLRRAVVSRSKGRMGSKVRPTIHQSGIHVTAGPHPMLFGTEYGMNSKSGWYAAERFRGNPHLQYFRHNGGGYWWRPTIERSKPEADAAVKRALDEAVSRWG